MTMAGNFQLLRYSPTLRFTVFGAMSYTGFSVVGVFLSLRSSRALSAFHAKRMSLTRISVFTRFSP